MANDIEKIYIGGNLLPVSSTLLIDEEDVSSPDAGRTEDGTMHKMRIGSLKSISLTWNNLKTEELYEILNMIKDEYITIDYFDPKTCMRKSSTFYVGNRSMAMYNGVLNLWQNLGFKFIERSVS